MINEKEEEIQKGLERLAEAKVEVAQMEIEVILSRLVALNLKSHRNVSVRVPVKLLPSVIPGGPDGEVKGQKHEVFTYSHR
jgi:hypothetical protein